MAKNYAKRDFKKRSPSKSKNNLGWLWLLTGILIGGFGFGLVFLKKNITVTTDAPAALTQAPTVKTLPPAIKHSQPVAVKASADDKTRYDFYTMLPNSSTQTQPASPPTQAPTLKATKPLDQAEQSMFNQTATAAVPPNPNTATASPTTPAKALPANTPVKATITNSDEPSDLASLKTTALTEKPVLKKPPLDEGTRYSIDSGSFASYELADAHKAELTMAGFTRIHIESYVKGDDATRYRVLVGPYKNKTDAASAQKSLESDHFASELITAP